MKKLSLLLVSLICVATACSNIEKNLSQAAQSPSSGIAVKDTKGGYWGFPGSTIKQVEGKKLTFKIGEPVRYCTSGEGPAEALGRALIGDTSGAPASQGSQTTWKFETSWGILPIEAGPDQSIRTSGWDITGVSGSGENKYSLSGCVPGRIAKSIEIEVNEILYSTPGGN